MVQWDDRLCIGISEVDIQHKMLFEHFNTFLTACESGAETEAAYRLFWFLEAYALAHFQDEEELMQRVGFPDLNKQRAQHQAFAAEVARLKAQLNSEGATPDVVSTITSFITGWLTHHVSVMDSAIASFMTQSGMHVNF